MAPCPHFRAYFDSPAGGQCQDCGAWVQLPQDSNIVDLEAWTAALLASEAKPDPPRVDTRERFCRRLLGEDYKPF